MGLAGKTIDRVEDRDYHGQRVWFTDGTCADFNPCGYEADGVEIEELTTEDLERQRVEAEQEACRRQVERDRATRRREALRMEMQSLLTPCQYEKWLADQQQTAANFSKIMRDTFIPAIKADMHRQVYGG